MIERDIAAGFKGNMISLAAEDERIYEVTGRLLFLKSDGSVTAAANLMASVAEYYVLEPEDMVEVLRLSEHWAWEGYD